MFSRKHKKHQSQIAAPSRAPSVASAVGGIAEKDRGGQGGRGLSHSTDALLGPEPLSSVALPPPTAGF